jgi:hypothetical protein
MLSTLQSGASSVAFPPNYSQERTSRDRDRARKALKKLQKRDDKSDQRKAERVLSVAKPVTNELDKEPK